MILVSVQREQEQALEPPALAALRPWPDVSPYRRVRGWLVPLRELALLDS